MGKRKWGGGERKRKGERKGEWGERKWKVGKVWDEKRRGVVRAQ